ncbi:MAG TPA: VCBS repeat-containing protein, partial [Nannocystaceae bacterium]|nr:VCBS repeat-containing protein [Nannocystaceae bacterium]
VQCWPSTGDGFAAPIVGPALSDASGWDAEQYFGTIRLADIDGDGKDDLCARAADGFSCWRSRGDGFDEPFSLTDLSDANGFDVASRFGTIRMADLDADARTDVCARTDVGMRCWPSTGTGFGAPIEGPAWSDDAGFGRVEYWSTIRLVDLDADRRADLCVRTSTGMQCHLGDGSGFGEMIAGPAWSDESGWWDYSNYATIRFADLDADGDLDVCARANAGMRCAAWQDGAFGETVEGPAMSDDTDWHTMARFGTLRFVDLDADGRADLCGRGAAGITCFRSTGAIFDTAALLGPEWSDDKGWSKAQYFETVHAVPSQRRCVIDERCDDGVDDDCDGEIDEGCEVAESSGDEGGGDDESSAGAETTAAAPGTSGDDDALPSTFGELDDGAGCGCTSGGSSPWALVLLLRRRRRRR